MHGSMRPPQKTQKPGVCPVKWWCALGTAGGRERRPSAFESHGEERGHRGGACNPPGPADVRRGPG